MENTHTRDITRARQRAFLQAFAKLGTVRASCDLVNIGRRTHYAWMEDPAYAQAFERAKEDAVERLEAIARSRAIRKYGGSDILLMFLLKSMRPERYRDNAKVEHSGPGGGALSVELVFRKPHEETATSDAA